jgi:hypothetical protein
VVVGVVGGRGVLGEAGQSTAQEPPAINNMIILIQIYHNFPTLATNNNHNSAIQPYVQFVNTFFLSPLSLKFPTQILP